MFMHGFAHRWWVSHLIFSTPAARPEGSQAEPSQRRARQLPVLVQPNELRARIRDFEDAPWRGAKSAPAALSLAGRRPPWFAPAAGAETVRDAGHWDDGFPVRGDGVAINRMDPRALAEPLEHRLEIFRHKAPLCRFRAPHRSVVSYF